LAKDRGNEQMVAAHLNPTPQIALGEALGASGLVNAMMDVSDGIATDLSHLCAESGVGAEIEENLIPLSEELLAAAGVLQHSPLDWALSGGEDYQLLFTASASNGNRLKSLIKESIGVNISRIGRIVKGEGVHLRSFGKTVEVSYSGFDHFSPGS
jgi:thiamine-monophosphate kinase